MLAFKKRIWVPAIEKEFLFIEAIENGTKTQTIRKSDFRVNIHSLQPFGAPGFFRPGRLYVKDKYVKKFDELDYSEVLADGFCCWDDFYELMRVLNPKFQHSWHVLVIKFEYLNPEQVIRFHKTSQNGAGRTK